MVETAELVYAIRGRWRSDRISYRQGIRTQDLREFESKNQVSIPADLRSYLLIVDGFAENTYDHHEIRFWPLAEFSPAPAAPEWSGAFFIFADFLLDSHLYAVNMARESSNVVLVGGPAPLPIASTFSDFLRLYLHDPVALFPPRASR